MRPFRNVLLSADEASDGMTVFARLPGYPVYAKKRDAAACARYPIHTPERIATHANGSNQSPSVS